MVSISPKNPFPTAGMEDFVEKYFSTGRKKTDSSLWKIENKLLFTNRKSVSPTMKMLSLAVIFFKIWIFPNFNNGFPLAEIKL